MKYGNGTNDGGVVSIFKWYLNTFNGQDFPEIFADRKAFFKQGGYLNKSDFGNLEITRIENPDNGLFVDFESRPIEEKMIILKRLKRIHDRKEASSEELLTLDTIMRGMGVKEYNPQRWDNWNSPENSLLFEKSKSMIDEMSKPSSINLGLTYYPHARSQTKGLIHGYPLDLCFHLAYQRTEKEYKEYQQQKNSSLKTTLEKSQKPQEKQTSAPNKSKTAVKTPQKPKSATTKSMTQKSQKKQKSVTNKSKTTLKTAQKSQRKPSSIIKNAQTVTFDETTSAHTLAQNNR